MPLLSIQIPTVKGREKEYAFIEEVIRNQCATFGEDALEGFLWDGIDMGGWRSEDIEFLYCRDNKEMTIGEKRERMYEGSSALYSWQIDDDDSIDGGAIAKVLAIIQQASAGDCITFKELCTINGQEFTSNHSLKYDDWGENKDGYNYVRTPYMKDVILTKIARSVPIPHCRFGEDHEWSRLLKAHLKTETHIDEFIYFYNHTSTNHEERYGIK